MVFMFRAIKQAFQNIGRNGWMSLAAVTAVAVSLFLVGVFATVLVNANKFASDLEGDVTIRAYVDLAADEDDIEEIEAELHALSGVEAVEFSSKDQELERIQSYDDSLELFEGDENPLPHVFIVYSASADQTPTLADEISQLTYISEVDYGGSLADNLFNFINNFRLVAIIAGIILLLTAFFLIGNTIRITIFSRREEIEIMKLVGATNWFIRWPYVIEGIILGLLGSLIPFLIIAFSYYSLAHRSLNFLATSSYQLVAPMPYLLYLGIGMVVVGILIGIISATSAIRRFLKI